MTALPDERGVSHAAAPSKRMALKTVLFQGPKALIDRYRNWRYTTEPGRFLIVHHAAKPPHSHRDFFRWVNQRRPEIRARFEFRLLPCRRLDWSKYILHVSWAGDTMSQWSARSQQRAEEILAGCDQRGIPVINRADQLKNASKWRGAARIASVGLRTPRTVRIDKLADFRRDLAGMRPPLLIREESGHGQLSVKMDTADDLKRVRWEDFCRPVATEFIDVRDQRDGLFRKYRCLCAGPTGIARHLIINDRWEVRPQHRIRTDAARREELDYLHHPDPNHAQLQQARQALGLDIVGFDYSYDPEGQIVVWEANPYPDLNYPKHPWSRHIDFAVERSFAAVVHLYLSRSGLEPPADV